ncbi:MAG: HAD family phosphatase [Candidatus Omnitrophica bacterium]|nr:HAD family phosphatase [Candidatus Omnitrophota bacterium]MDD5027150.1 HAD family phosphatase [Candidatus Omnitrophota bacterium]MDD5661612.1 HAD family phosphatase [Candidatus Omnitrophota bacterium]
MDEGIKVVLFDLGNVLIDFDYNISAERIARFCDGSPKEIAGFFLNSEITALFEEGKISPVDFFTKVKTRLDLRLSYAAFVPIWDEIFFLSAKNRSVYNLINNLKLRYRVALISNIDVLHYEYLKNHFPVFNVFDRLFLSYELGLVKPNPLIYQKVLATLKVGPENVFYTDDRPELVESAQRLGIKSFVFSGIAQLKNDLFRAEITVN